MTTRTCYNVAENVFGGPVTRTHVTLLCALMGVLCAVAAEAQVARISPARQTQDGQIIEVFVDEQGKIYKELRYQGIIPGIRDEVGRIGKYTAKGKRPILSWVGFQSKQFYSRIFIKVSPVSRFIMRKPDANRIIVDIDDARIPSRQTRRPILTSAYDTAVQSIQAKPVKGGAQVEITLRKPAGYLYKRQGDYIFIDIER